MNDDKIYYPEEISDIPLPGQDPLITPQSSTSSGSQGTYNQTVQQDRPLPRPRVARETINSVINTKSRKILDTFEFTKMGALQIGEYILGISGDIRLSPNGILTRNISGQNTVAIDGDTGDVTIIGTMRAGSFIGVNGNVAIEESEEGNGRIVLYNDGIPAIIIGDPT